MPEAVVLLVLGIGVGVYGTLIGVGGFVPVSAHLGLAQA